MQKLQRKKNKEGKKNKKNKGGSSAAGGGSSEVNCSGLGLANFDTFQDDIQKGVLSVENSSGEIQAVPLSSITAINFSNNKLNDGDALRNA